MKKLTDQIWPKWFLHIFFWILFYLYDGPISNSIEEVSHHRDLTAALNLPVKILATYLTLYLITKFYHTAKNKYIFAGSLALSILGLGIFQRFISYQLLYPIFYPEGLSHPLWYFPKIVMEIFGLYSVVGIAVSIILTQKWYVNQQENQLLKSEKLDAQLSFLKSQIHPHFLFNTLNNLYAITLIQTERAPEIVHKLSQLLHYMLYECDRDVVNLKSELEYLEDYISLEKIRYDDYLDVSINIYDDLSDVYIAPLLILPFIENSFKHGFKDEHGRHWVSISLLKTEIQLVIKVENSLPNGAINKIENHKGIGLENVKKRLELIYHTHYSLNIEADETYLVNLKIDLDQLKNNIEPYEVHDLRRRAVSL